MKPAAAPAVPASETLAPLESALCTEELNRRPARSPNYERENGAFALSSRQVVGDSEDRFRFMAEFMPQKIFSAKPDGNIDYFNQQWIDYTGLSFETMRNSGWDQFIHADDVEENMRLWKHSLETGEPFNFSHRCRRFDGTYRWHLSRARAMRDTSGNISVWIASTTDIHEQKETEEKLRQANEDLRQFAFAASHDLQECFWQVFLAHFGILIWPTLSD